MVKKSKNSMMEMPHEMATKKSSHGEMKKIMDAAKSIDVGGVMKKGKKK